MSIIVCKFEGENSTAVSGVGSLVDRNIWRGVKAIVCWKNLSAEEPSCPVDLQRYASRFLFWQNGRKIACLVSAVAVSWVARAVLDSERAVRSEFVAAGAAVVRTAKVRVNRMMNRGTCIVTDVRSEGGE